MWGCFSLDSSWWDLGRAQAFLSYKRSLWGARVARNTASMVGTQGKRKKMRCFIHKLKYLFMSFMNYNSMQNSIHIRTISTVTHFLPFGCMPSWFAQVSARAWGSSSCSWVCRKGTEAVPVWLDTSGTHPAQSHELWALQPPQLQSTPLSLKHTQLAHRARDKEDSLSIWLFLLYKLLQDFL